jgi:hypothetical protein
MHFRFTHRLLALTLLTGAALVASQAPAADESQTLSLADGKITIVAPAGWTKKMPATNIVQYEFAIPKAQGDQADGRVTVMGAGGSIEANIDRWVSQFETADGKPLPKEAKKIEKTNIGGLEVHVVDLGGSYKDMTRPFGGQTTLQKDYRMIGAIIVSPHGNYFVKAYGPKKTMEPQREAINKMLETIKAK